MKKRLLVLAYKFPPYEGVGARRWAKFAKYLVRSKNVETWLVANTWKNDGAKSWVHDVPPNSESFKLIKLSNPLFFTSQNKFLSKIYWRVNTYLANFFGWTDEAYPFYIWNFNKIVKIINQNRIDNVVATGGPFSSNYFAAKLKERFPEINIIQDFRDLWTEEYFTEFPDRTKEHPFYIKEVKMEQFALKNSDTIVSVTPGYLSRLKSKAESYGIHSGNYKLMENGYDEEDKRVFKLDNRPVDFPANKTIIAHFGTLEFGREKEFYSFLHSVKDELILNNGIEIHQFGRIPSTIVEKVQEIGLSSVVKFHAFMPPEKVQNYMFFSDYHLVINDKVFHYAFGTKIYDAFMYNKKVILVCAKGPLFDRVVNEQLGYATTNTHEENKKVINELLLPQITTGNEKNLDYTKYSIPVVLNEYFKLFK